MNLYSVGVSAGLPPMGTGTIPVSHRRRVDGSVLLITLGICLILGILIGSYLSLTSAQNLSVSRAQAWNTALVVAEAGVEEAMAHLNSGVSTNDLGVNSWVSLGGGVYEKTNWLGNSYSIVDIKFPPAVTNTSPLVVATAYVPGPVSGPKLTRTVQVTTKPKPTVTVPGGMVVTTTINLKGSGITLDSFDSTDPTLSTGGIYDVKKARDRSQASTISSATNAIQVDNGTIKGSVHTGPGGQVSIGGGAVGDSVWITAKKPGIQPGHSADDASFNVADNSLPTGQTWVTPSQGKYKINGINYKYILDSSSAWKIPNLSGSVYINGANVVLYVSDVLNLGSGTQITVAPGASVSMYVGAPTASIGGSGVVNLGGQAKDFIYYGLPSNTQFGLRANAAFTGYINAPEADFTLGGGGNNYYDFVGACLVKSVVMNGHFHFHYDESLVVTPAPSGYVVTSWDDP